MELNMTELLLKASPLFNENGSDSYKDQALIGGNPTGIANLNNVRYTWANKIYRTMVGNFWIPQKVALTDDNVSMTKLEPAELSAVKNTLSFLIFMDSFQTNNLPNISEAVTCQAVKNLLIYQASQEVIHSESYQYILEALFPNSEERENVYDKWRSNPVLKKRNKMIADIAQAYLDNPTEENFHKVVIANLCLEGIYFYQGFNLFDQLAHRKKLVQTAKVIDYIRNDEQTHLGIFVNMIKELEIDRELTISIVKQAVEQEVEWCHDTYGDNILGISKKSSETYVKWLANERLGRIGIDPIYPDALKDPYAHLTNASKAGKKRENHFESTITAYDTADSVDGWDSF